MPRTLAVLLLLIAAGGCQSEPVSGRGAEPMFAPAAMRIHPIFTRLRDWNGDDKPDGVEALIEFQDQFGDPTKAAGRVVFELYDYRPGWPDPRGSRLAEPWLGSLLSAAEQRQHWNRTSRSYSFQLAYPPIRPDRSYVLTAMFELAGGGRYFDRIVLEGRSASEPESQRAQPIPSTATQPAQP